MGLPSQDTHVLGAQMGTGLRAVRFNSDWCHAASRLTYVKMLRMLNVRTNEFGPLYS